MASKQVICSYTLFLDLVITTLLACPFACCLLVPQSPIDLQYHKGALLAGDGPIKLHLTFYGDFTSLEKNTIKSFLSSLSESTPASHIAQASSTLLKSVRRSLKSVPPEGGVRRGRRGFPSSVHPKAIRGLSSKHLKASGFSSSKLKASAPSSAELKGSGSTSSKLDAGGSSSSAELKASGSSSSPELKADGSSFSNLKASGSSPSVSDWWSLTQAYTDLRGNPVSQTVLLEHEASDNYSLGKLLSHSDVALLAKRSARAVSQDQMSIHVILTAADVGVEGFCMHACGQHAHTETDGELGRVVYAWVGNSWKQCPGYCSWPFVRAVYGPDVKPLGAPNSASADGMVINLAKVLVEAATDPYGDGYHIGAGSHGGIGGVCTGVYGEGAYPGYPGKASADALTGGSFNVMGLHQSKFLLPYIWNPLTLSCAVHP